MKSRQLMLLVIAALVLGGGGLWMLKKRQASFDSSKVQMGDSVLGPFDGSAVTAVRIKQGSNSVNIVTEGSDWVVRERGNFPANVSELQSFFRKLTDLKVTRPVKVGASRLPLLELSGDSGTVVELLDASGKAVKTLRLGKQTTKGGGDEGPMGMGGGAFPDGRYVQVGEVVSLINDPLSNAKPAPADWIAKEFIKVEQPVTIQITHPEATNSFTLSRTNEFAEWTLGELAAGESLDKNKLWSFNNILSSPSFTDIILNPDAAKLGLDQPTLAKIKTSGGLNYDVKVGKPEGDNYPVQVTVTGDLAKERTAGADEKPEDKERLDKEFKEKLAKREQQLKTEQALGKWTFTVSKWTVDPILKKRSELLADKKPATPPANGAVPPGEPEPDLDPTALPLPVLPDDK
ncbi:MAG TPA: DUF4340 domain-containing protein [Verrucomicrobiota bacterium]|nr:DUF4340 domain-containing protein [Verrucomicrobiota bacterium]